MSDFRLDNYVVTVGRFRAFVDAGMGTSTTAPPAAAGAHDKIPGSGWDSSWNANLAVDTASLQCDSAHQTWTASAGSNESLPMNCLSWYEAFAFCIWDGGYLPTEAEWNYAAAGGSDQRAYPWSSPANSTTIDCTYADYDINTPAGTYCVNGATGGTDRVGSQSPKGDGRWGQSDLAGNVWQWAFDWYGTSYPSPCDDCAGLTQQAPYGRVLRGGSYGGTSDKLRVGLRFKNQPGGTRFADQGVRCARTP